MRANRSLLVKLRPCEAKLPSTWRGARLPFLCTFISFYGHVKASLWRWLLCENQQQHYRTTHNRKQKKKENMERKIWSQMPPSPQQAMAMSEERIIDFDREESSNWNETCLNNSLNVSFPAFQITCTVKPDCFLLASSQRTFCVQGACERREKKKSCEFASLWMTVEPAFQVHIDNLLILNPQVLPAVSIPLWTIVNVSRGWMVSGWGCLNYSAG